nr:semaphorin-6A-like [Pogona vitticeps]
MRTDVVLLYLTLIRFGASIPKDPPAINVVSLNYTRNYPAFMGNKADYGPLKKNKMDIQLLLISDRTLYIGARNRVYSLNLDESHTDEIYYSGSLLWNPSEDAEEKCRIYGQQEEECNNFIKVLLRRNEDTLFICGTNAFSPSCAHYQVDSLELKGDYISGAGRCPHDRKDGNIALFADDNLYSGTVTDFQGSDPIIYRSLGDLPNLRTVKYDSRWLKEPHFVHAVDYGDYIYFFFGEISVEYYGVEKVILPRVARVCKDDRGGNQEFLEKEWTSFLKARLVCAFPADPPLFFNHLESVTDVVNVNGQDMVFAIFTTPKHSIPTSACCAFALDDIDKVFTGRFKQQRTPVSLWTPVPDNEVPTPRPGSCAGSGSLEGYASSTSIPSDTLAFSRTHTLMDESVKAVSRHPLFLRTPFMAEEAVVKIAVDTAAGPNEDHTVLFIGSERGRLSKVLLRKEGSVLLEEMYIYNYQTCLHSEATRNKIIDMKVDKPNKVLYVAFAHCVIKVPLGGCERHGPCKKACIRSRDPYCGWANEACIHLVPGIPVDYEQDIEHGNTDGLEDC